MGSHRSPPQNVPRWGDCLPYPSHRTGVTRRGFQWTPGWQLVDFLRLAQLDSWAGAALMEWVMGEGDATSRKNPQHPSAAGVLGIL